MGQIWHYCKCFLPIVTIESFERTAPESLKMPETISPLGHIGTAEKDCGPLIVFLASKESHYITGQTFMLDGGINKIV